MLMDARRRASRQGVPFGLQESDIVIPSVCPILGIRIDTRRGTSVDSSPSLDRIVPAKGYVPGNVQIVSNRANTLKRDASMRELRMLGEFAINHSRRNPS